MKYLSAFYLKIQFLFSVLPYFRFWQVSTIILSSCFHFLSATGQSELSRTVFTTEDGLAGNQTFCGFMDSKGYMWIGTSNGLSRYDGHGFKNFKHDPRDSTSICHNNIRDIYEDEDNFLWIATGEGLAKYDPKTESFKCFVPISEDSTSISGLKTRNILTDSEGNIWIGTFYNGFYLFNKEEGRFTRFDLVNELNTQRKIFEKNTTFDIIEDISDPNILWIGGQGVFQFNKQTQELKRINAKPFAVMSLYMDKPGELWMSHGGGRGLARYLLEKDEWQYYYPEALGGNPFAADRSNVHIYDILKKNEDELWLGSTPQGIIRFNRKSKKFIFLDERVVDSYFSDENWVEKLTIDKQGRLWAFTWAGTVLLDKNEIIIPQYQIPRKNKKGYKGYITINDITVDSNNNYWLATSYGQGIYKFKKDSKSAILNVDVLDTESEREWESESEWQWNRIYAILVDADNDVWAISGIDSKFLKWNPNSHIFEQVQPERFKALFNEASFLPWTLLEDHLGNIWIGTAYGGIIKYDKKENSFTQYVSWTEDTLGIDFRASIEPMILNAAGNLWVPTTVNGAYVFNIEEEAFVNKYQYLPGQNTGLLENRIRSIAEGPENNIWFGYDSKGIQIIDPSIPNEQVIRTPFYDEGLPSSRIFGIRQDQNGNMWIITESELYKYEYSKKKFVKFGKREGIYNTLYWDTPFKVLKNGEIFIGKKDGSFYLFHPDSIPVNLVPPNIVFNDFEVFYEIRHFEKSLNYLNRITLNYKENFFTIHFAALNFTRPQKNQYKYRLEGFDPDTIYSGHRNFANYTNVPEGNYTFWVTGSNNDDVWNEKGISIEIFILPPWYRTNWAYAIYFMLFGASLFALYLFQKRRWQLKMQLELEHAETGRLKELDETKTRLYTNITHEFRTPLTIILGMVNQMTNNPKDWFSEGTKMIRRNGLQLLHLVNQMLDLSKLESGTLPLRMVHGDVNQYLRYLTESFHSFAESKNISLHFLAEEASIMMDYDPDKLLQIASNLLSNALKYTPEGGNVYIQVQTLSQLTTSQKEELTHSNKKNDFLSQMTEGKKRKSFLELKVKDTGIGIPQNQLLQVFDRFYQVDESQTRKGEGTGIGLALTKELVKLLGGSIQADSQKDRGSVFTVLLPIHHNATKTDGINQSSIQLGVEGFTTKAAATNLEEIAVQTEDLPLLLIIEDNPDVVSYLIACLEQHYQLVIAHNGAEGIDKAIELIPDIIISDVMMPEKDGFEVCDTLKNELRTSHIPLVLLTAKADSASRIQGLKRGADAYLLKPFHKEELLVRLEQLIALRKKLQKRYRAGEAITLSKDPAYQLEDTFLLKIQEVIELHLPDADFDMKDLEKAMLMSHSQIYRKIKVLTNKSIAVYIRTIRLQKAKDLLQTTNLNISEIAYKVGFTSPSYFSKTFLEEFGVQPNHFKHK